MPRRPAHRSLHHFQPPPKGYWLCCFSRAAKNSLSFVEQDGVLGHSKVLSIHHLSVAVILPPARATLARLAELPEGVIKAGHKVSPEPLNDRFESTPRSA